MSRKLKIRETTSLLIIFCGAGIAVAQFETDFSQQLKPILEKIENPEPFQPIAAERLAVSKDGLAAAMSELDQRLARNGNAAAELWKKYLRWSDLEAELGSEKPSRVNLIEIGDLFRMNHPGLEMKVFRNLRDAIYDYAWTSYFSAGTRAEKLYGARLKQIKTAIVALQTGQDDARIGEIGVWVSDLANAGQCPKLVAMIRTVFSRSNFQLQISEAFAQRILAGQPSSDVRPVQETILGVLQCGSASTTATVDVDFIPNKRSANFQVCILGKTISDQVGYKDIGLLGSIRICSQGNTDLVAESNVYFDGQHVTHTGISAAANTRTQIKGVSTPPLLRGIVLKQINSKKSEGEAIGADLAKKKFKANVSQKLITAVGDANRAISDRYNTPASRIDFVPRGTVVSTTDDSLRIVSLVGNDSQLGILNSASMDDGQDIAIQIHESVMNNAFEHFLGGRTFTNDGLRKLATQFGAKPRPVEPDEKEVEIKFKRTRPVSVSFSEDSVVIKIAISSLKQEGVDFKDFVISAEYALDVRETTIDAKRLGDVTLDFAKPLNNVENGKLGVVDQKLKEIFLENFETIDLSELELKPEIRSIGMPRLSNFNMKQGWLSVGVNLDGTRFAISDHSASPKGNSARILGAPVRRSVSHVSSD